MDSLGAQTSRRAWAGLSLSQCTGLQRGSSCGNRQPLAPRGTSQSVNSFLASTGSGGYHFGTRNISDGHRRPCSRRRTWGRCCPSSEMAGAVENGFFRELAARGDAIGGVIVGRACPSGPSHRHRGSRRTEAPQRTWKPFVTSYPISAVARPWDWTEATPPCCVVVATAITCGSWRMPS